jgi:FkbM family methyltransferase
MLAFLYHKQRFLIRAYKYLYKFDPEEIKYIRKNLEEGDVAFDLGAHKGAYTYWMHKSVRKSGKIVSIEPQPLLFEYLKKMIPIFGFTNVTLMDCAVSDTDSEGVITVPGKLGSISQGARIDDQKIVQNKHKQDLHTIKVNIRSVDSIIAETGLKPKIIKIDVEGHEFSVLKGMARTLTEVRPRIIMECEERHIKDFTVFDVFNFLLEKNYEGYYFQSGEKYPLSNFDLQRDQTSYIDPQPSDPNYIANFIFEPK